VHHRWEKLVDMPAGWLTKLFLHVCHVDDAREQTFHGSIADQKACLCSAALLCTAWRSSRPRQERKVIAGALQPLLSVFCILSDDSRDLQSLRPAMETAEGQAAEAPTIRRLEEAVVNRIAAGEVIQARGVGIGAWGRPGRDAACPATLPPPAPAATTSPAASPQPHHPKLMMQRPSSALKEMLENSLDAGATHIMCAMPRLC
jgi:hypothetical protein